MAQTTNLNVSPYFDDFNADDNYYKVLFKPGVPVQARELTGLQSILQNQIAKFGQHFFKEGSKVIPGNTTYIDNYKCVVINKEYLGIKLTDGLYDDANKSYLMSYNPDFNLRSNMAYILHQADMMATHIEFDQWNRGTEVEEPMSTKVPKTKDEQKQVDNLKQKFDELFA